LHEIAQVTEARADEAKKAILESTPIIESDEPGTGKQVNNSYREMSEIHTPEIYPQMSILQKEVPETSQDFASEAEVTGQPLFGKNVRPVTDGRHQRILELWEQGISIEEIAKELGTGRGEVQLILGIYRRS